jgi:hypothetical protein
VSWVAKCEMLSSSSVDELEMSAEKEQEMSALSLKPRNKKWAQDRRVRKKILFTNLILLLQ